MRVSDIFDLHVDAVLVAELENAAPDHGVGARLLRDAFLTFVVTEIREHLLEACGTHDSNPGDLRETGS